MSEIGSAVTNAQLADELREEAEAPGFMAKSSLLLAAHRLEAREVSEAMVEAFCRAFHSQLKQQRPEDDPPDWHELTDDQRNEGRAFIRAALEAAMKG